jgi:hypothetical protein
LQIAIVSTLLRDNSNQISCFMNGFVRNRPALLGSGCAAELGRSLAVRDRRTSGMRERGLWPTIASRR